MSVAFPDGSTSPVLPDINSSFLQDVVRGLSSTPKQLPCKYFYDVRGAELFEQICLLEEYYLTRTELTIMRTFARPMGSVVGGPVTIVELGSGSSLKTRLLLEHVPGPVTYVPVDLSSEHLLESARKLAAEFPSIEVLPLCADFTQPFTLPRPAPRSERVVVYFPGSTVGNFEPGEAVQLFQRIRSLIAADGGLLIGIDLEKETSVLEAAYDDSRQVTAQFNLNLLARINRELHANFDLAGFTHRARYNQQLSRIEMYLDSQKEQSVRIGPHEFAFGAGEAICTEYSHKYRVDEFARLAAAAGFQQQHVWTDERQWFAVLFFAAK